MALQIPYSSTRGVGLESPSPAYDNRRGAPEEAFGAGVGRAVVGLGQSVDRLGDSMVRSDLVLKADAVERENLNRSTDYVQFSNQEQELLAKAKREVTGTDAYGFVDTYMKGLNERIAARQATVRPQDKEKWNLEYEKLRATQHRQAFGAEIETRDATQQTRMKSSFDTLGKQIEDDPTRRDFYISNGNQTIDATNFPPAVKEQLKKTWKDQATYIYGSSMARKEPLAVREALSPASDQAMELLRKFEGFKTSTYWDVNAHRTGYGSDTITRADGTVERVEKGSVVSREDAERDLRRRVGQSETKASEQTGREAWDKMSASAKAALTSITYNYGKLPEGVVAAVQTGDREKVAQSVERLKAHNEGVNSGRRQQEADIIRGGGSRDQLAALNDLPLQQRDQLRGAAERTIKTNEAAEATRTQEQYNGWLNGFQIQLSNGSAGREEINNAVATGRLTEFNDIQKLLSIVNKREEAGYYTTTGNAALQSPGTAWNPFDKEQQKQVNAVYDAQVGPDRAKNLGNGLNLWNKTKIIPEAMATTLRGALISTDGATMMRALQVVSSMYTADPNAFAAAGPAKADLEEAATAFNHKINDLGYTAREAAQQIAQMNDPEHKAKMKVKDDDLKKFKDDILKNTMSNITSPFSNPDAYLIFNRSVQVGSGQAQRTGITNIFTELAYDNYAKHGDRALAISQAQQKMSSMFGVTNGVLRQYPPEKAAGYPALPDGTKSYIYQQAADDLFAKEGIKVNPKDITLVPIPYTAEAFRNGEPVPYAITYKKENGVAGIVLRDGVNPLPWSADFNKALETWRMTAPVKMEAIRSQDRIWDSMSGVENPIPPTRNTDTPKPATQPSAGPFPEGTVRFRRGPAFQSQAERKF